MIRKVIAIIACLVILGGLVAASFYTQETWKKWFPLFGSTEQAREEEPEHHDEDHIDLTPQARENMGLVLKPVKLTTFTRSIQIPGTIVNQPGVTKMKISTPITGAVNHIAATPGQVVKPGDPLFVLHLHSHELQKMQAELYKTCQEIVINEKERQRLKKVTNMGVIAGKEMLQLEYQRDRLQATKVALEQSLRVHRFDQDQIDSIIAGKFVKEITISVPQVHKQKTEEALASFSPAISPQTNGMLVFEMMDLNVHLGDQIQPGQTLCILANHQSLYLEGRVFRQEMSIVEDAIQKEFNVEAEILQDADQTWVTPSQPLKILYMDHHVDKASQTAGLYVPLTNEVKHEYQKNGRTYRLWKYRPGQRVYLKIAVEKFDKVYILPKEAITRDGLEVLVFRQNGDILEPRPVHLIHEGRNEVVIGFKHSKIFPGNIIAHNGADQLHRAMKAQAEGDAGGHHHHHPH